MAKLFFTIDTEYESGFTAKHGRDTRAANFERSIAGRVGGGEAGIFYQMDMFDACGMKAVFFVDPAPALLWGTRAIADIVEPVVARGHEVQLHMHTEWLALAEQGRAPVPDAGPNMKNYGFEEQCRLLEWGKQVLVDAGAPAPSVFRAGNYGANEDTLRALAETGFTHDTSHAPAVADSACEIGLGSSDRLPVERGGIIEVPVSCIGLDNGPLRHAQLTALTVLELQHLLRCTYKSGGDDVTVVSHSFELLSRKRDRINRVLRRRFERFCRRVRADNDVQAVTYADHKPRPPAPDAIAPAIPANPVHTGLRMFEQAFANTIYDM